MKELVFADLLRVLTYVKEHEQEFVRTAAERGADVKRFVALVRRYSEISKLTYENVHEFIDRLITVIFLLIGLCLGLTIRIQPEGNLAQLPLVQVPAAPLILNGPALRLQQVLEGKGRQFIRNSMLLAQPLAVVPVDDDYVLIDDDRRVADVFQQARLQGGKLLPRKRGSSSVISVRIRPLEYS